MKKLALYLGLGLMLAVASCKNQNETDPQEAAENQNEQKEDNGTLSEAIDDDVAFVAKVSGGVMMEAELGEYAQQHAASADVKEFGAMMVKDHSKDRATLEAMAAQKNISIPNAMPEDRQEHIDALKKYTGAEFDKKYIDFMVDDHKEDIDAFEEQIKDGKDADVVAFANKGLPILKEHLSKAQAIKDKLK